MSENKSYGVITYKKQTSKTKHIIDATLEYRPPLNISRNFFFFQKKKNKSRGFYSRKYDKYSNGMIFLHGSFITIVFMAI